MTNDKLQQLASLVRKGQEILGEITMLKERISWLENGISTVMNVKLNISAKNQLTRQYSNSNADIVDLLVSDDMLSNWRQQLLLEYKNKLSSMETRFANLSEENTQ